MMHIHILRRRNLLCWSFALSSEATWALCVSSTLGKPCSWPQQIARTHAQRLHSLEVKITHGFQGSLCVHAGQPDSVAHLQSSGILPSQGPLGAGQEALQRLSYSSDASDASLAQRAQRIEEEAMLYLSHSSSGDSARTGGGAGARLGFCQGDMPMYLSHSSNDSSAHPLMHTVQQGAVPEEVADDEHAAGETVQVQGTTAGVTPGTPPSHCSMQAFLQHRHVQWLGHH